MGTRERIGKRCRPFLGDDTDVEYAFVARAVGFNAFRIVVVTSDEIVVLDNKHFGYRPKAILRRLPRRTRIGPVSVFGGQTTSLGEPLQLYPRWVREIRRADAALDEADPTSAR